MNELAGLELTKARERKNYTQTELANLLATRLNQSYSLRQYQKLEAGDFPKFKKEIVTALDELLSTSLYALIYEQEILEEKPVIRYISKRRDSKLASAHRSTDVSHINGVPIFDVPIDASFLERYRDESYFAPFFYLNHPKLRNCDFGAIISGSSMYPIMKSGSIAVCRVVEEFSFFEAGEMYFLSTVNGFETVKYVQHTDNLDELLLIPHNEKIRPYPIKKANVLKMCIVEAWLNFR